MRPEEQGGSSDRVPETIRNQRRYGKICPIDILSLALLFAGALRFTANLETNMDVRSADETGYMHAGRTLPSRGLNPPEFSPLYQLWYFMLSRVVSDPLELYYFNYRMLVVLLPLATFLLLRSMRLSSRAAFAIGVLVIVSGIPYVWPFPAHFAAIVFMGCLYMAFRARTPLNGLACLALAFLLTAYVRPEYYLPFLAAAAFCGGWVILLILRNRQELRSSAASLICVAAAALVSLSLFGYPLGGQERGFMAFGQHYSLNRIESTKEDIDPWTNWRMILEGDFGDVNSMTESLNANPGAFFWHVRRNASNSAKQALFLVGGGAVFTSLPDRRDSIFLAAALGLLLAGWFSERARSSMKPAPSWLIGASIGGVLMTATPSALLIYPRHHYLLLPSLIILASLVYLLIQATIRSRPRSPVIPGLPAAASKAHAHGMTLSRWIWIPTACIAVLALPTREQNLPVSLHWETDMTMVKTIEFLRSMELTRDTGLLAADIGLEHYIEGGIRGVQPWDRMPQESISQFFERKSIGLVVDETHLRNDTRLRNSEDFKALLAEPTKFGFVPHHVPGTDRRLLVRRNLSG